MNMIPIYSKQLDAEEKLVNALEVAIPYIEPDSEDALKIAAFIDEHRVLSAEISKDMDVILADLAEMEKELEAGGAN